MKKNLLHHNIILQGAVFSIPVNSSDNEIKEYCRSWVLPFLRLAYNHIRIPYFFYISGNLFEYFEKKGKEYKDVLHELIGRKQIELLGGMYYDAAPIIQEKKDQRDQLEKLQNYIAKNYKMRINGVWLTPGTFDHSIIQTIRQSGASFIIANKAYLEPEPQYNYLGLLEQLSSLLLALPYGENFCEYLSDETKLQNFCQRFPGEKNNPAIYTIFSEYHRVQNLTNYFFTLEKMQKTIEENKLYDYCWLPHTFMKKKASLQKTICRIRSAPWGDEESGTFFKYILSRPESRLLYGRLQYITKFTELQKKKHINYTSVRVSLWAEQNHFSYWKSDSCWGIHHGMIRQNTYRALNSLEKMILTSLKKNKTSRIHTVDMNLDSIEEALIHSPSFTILIEPYWASIALLERSSNIKRWNYLSCFVPHFNPKYPPWSFKDFVFNETIALEDLHKKMINNIYPVTPVQYHEHEIAEAQMNIIYKGKASIPSPVEGALATVDLAIEKCYHVRGNSIVLSLQYKNNGQSFLSASCVFEVNLSFLSDKITACKIHSNQKQYKAEEFSCFNTEELRIQHLHKKEELNFTFTDKTNVSIAPVHEMSTVESNATTYQYTSFLFAIKISLESQQVKKYTIQLNFTSIPRALQ